MQAFLERVDFILFKLWPLTNREVKGVQCLTLKQVVKYFKN